MDMHKQEWFSVSGEIMSIEAVRNLYSPSSDYRFSPTKYEPRAIFPVVIGYPVTVYVLSGGCKYRLDGQELTLRAGEFSSFAKGSYEFEVLGGEQVQIITVFKLPSVAAKD
jgi:hypothetical protein